MAITPIVNTTHGLRTEQDSPTENCPTELTAPSSTTRGIISTEGKPESDNDGATDKKALRIRQIDVLAMQGPKKPKTKGSWLDTVGKHTENSPLTRIFEEGEKIREAERTEQC